MTGKKNILFVCTGNSCRSIMAEAYLKKRAKEESLAVDVMSAGTLGVNGIKPADPAIKIIEAEGMDPEGLESTALTKDIIDWADAILVMEPLHKGVVVAIAPEAGDKRANSATILRATDGSISAPPPATVRIASASSAPETSFNK